MPCSLARCKSDTPQIPVPKQALAGQVFGAPYARVSGSSHRRMQHRSTVSSLRRQQNFEASPLAYPGQMKLKAEGRHTEADIVKKIVLGRVPELDKLCLVIKPQPGPRRYNSTEALGLILNGDLSKQAYVDLRFGAIDHGIHLYPSYHQVLDTKKECHPEEIVVTEQCTEVPLQFLLDHTARRLLDLDLKDSPDNLVPTAKYGFDSAFYFPPTKQAFQDTFNETSFFLACLVPLLLRTSRGDLFWANQRTESKLFYRPIRF